MFRFFQRMIAFRKARRAIARSRFWRQDVHWYGVAGPVDFSYQSRSLAFFLCGAHFEEGDLYVMINVDWEPLHFHVQEGEAHEWRRVVDTSRPSPEDIAEPGRETPLSSLDYEVASRSIVVLEHEA